MNAAGFVRGLEMQLDAVERCHAVAVLAALQRDVLADHDLGGADTGLGGMKRRWGCRRDDETQQGASNQSSGFAGHHGRDASA